MTHSCQSVVEASDEGGGDGAFKAEENDQAEQPHGEIGEAHLADDRKGGLAWNLEYFVRSEFRLNDLADARDEETHSYGPEGEPPADKDKDSDVWTKVSIDGNGGDGENKEEQNHARKVQDTLPEFDVVWRDRSA